uniref:VPS37 C-terminal domain-containing protein n=1 Tax=Araucaria cunninghamii TaxID=56994 RepID=A0A0D6QTC6_ARACU
MFKPSWVVQHPTELSFPNIPAQSCYPPPMLTPFTDTGCPPLPSNLVPAGFYPFQSASAVTETSFVANSQSPSFSVPSPETVGTTIYCLLRNKSVDELRTIFTDKETYNKVLHSIGEVKHLNSMRDDLCMKTVQLAKKNLEKASQIAELRNQCAIIRTTELAVAQEKFDELEQQEQELARISPVALLEKLRDAANITEEESEKLYNLLMSGEIELSDFIQKHRKLRTLYHTRTLLRLAAMASVTSS